MGGISAAFAKQGRPDAIFSANRCRCCVSFPRVLVDFWGCQDVPRKVDWRVLTNSRGSAGDKVRAINGVLAVAVRGVLPLLLTNFDMSHRACKASVVNFIRESKNRPGRVLSLVCSSSPEGYERDLGIAAANKWSGCFLHGHRHLVAPEVRRALSSLKKRVVPLATARRVTWLPAS
jgi:hypothetical protein